MSETKNKTPEVEETTEQKPKKDAEKKPMTAIEKKFARVFPGEKMHKVRLPRYLGGDKKSIYVGVNGHSFQIPTGQAIEVPTPIFEQLNKLENQLEVLEGIRDTIHNEG